MLNPCLAGRVLRQLASHVLKQYNYETVGKPVQARVLERLAKLHPGLVSTEQVKTYAKEFNRMIAYRLRVMHSPAPISSVILSMFFVNEHVVFAHYEPSP